MVMGSGGARYQEQLCWQGAAAIYCTGFDMESCEIDASQGGQEPIPGSA
jgi:hypothetical protein